MDITLDFSESGSISLEFASAEILNAINSVENSTGNVQMYAVKESTETDGNVTIEGEE